MSENEKDMLKAKADRDYCDYIAVSRTTECLGWEAKVKAGTFGAAEIAAHERAAELLGTHRGLMQALALLSTPRHTEEVVEAAFREAAERLADKAECLRDPACDEAYYQQGKCAVCEAAEFINDYPSRAPSATKSGDGPCHWCSKPKAAHFYKNNQCYNDGGMTHCYLSSPPPPVTEQKEPKR